MYELQRKAAKFMSYQSSRKNDASDTAAANEPDDADIWGEADSDTNLQLEMGSDGMQTVKAGTLNKLVERLTHDKISDLTFMKTFITTYQSFTSPDMLLTKLIQRYHVPKKEGSTVSAQPIQLRVCSCLKFWIETHYPDFDEKMSERLKAFIKNSVEKDGHKLLASQLKQVTAHKAELEGPANFVRELSSPGDSKVPIDGMLHSHMFLLYSVEEIAKQMTLADFSLYQALQPVELLNQSWNKEKLRYRAPNLLALIDRFNSIGAWVSSIICWEESFELRRKKMKRVYQLNKELRKLKNFFAVAAVSAGLNTTAVHRLTHTKQALPKDLLAAQEELEELMKPDGSYKNYRHCIHTINPPCVPFLGVYLRDLVFIEDGNPDFTETGLINFTKRRATHEVIMELQQYQQQIYKFPQVEPLFTYMATLPFSGEEERYKLSLIFEPRNTTLETLMTREKHVKMYRSEIKSAKKPTLTSSRRESSVFFTGKSKISATIFLTASMVADSANVKKLLQKRGVDSVEVIDVDSNADWRDFVFFLTLGRSTLPQVFLNDSAVGSFEQVLELDQKGLLEERVKSMLPLTHRFPPSCRQPMPQELLFVLPEILRKTWKADLEKLSKALSSDTHTLSVLQITLSTPTNLVVVATVGPSSTLNPDGSVSIKGDAANGTQMMGAVCVTEQRQLIVDDMTQDIRFKNNIDCLKHGFRVYYGVPWVCGHSAGTVEALEREAGILKADHVAQLQQLAEKVQVDLDDYRNRFSMSTHEPGKARSSSMERQTGGVSFRGLSPMRSKASKEGTAESPARTSTPPPVGGSASMSALSPVLSAVSSASSPPPSASSISGGSAEPGLTSSSVPSPRGGLTIDTA
eukprot:TRINITY_DN343_c0_g1_i1.p1 TRINITY_DN343_c0_g1~~TRINITY_DN343_c0_g1_i1.p1  ORF type:complete len:1009 (-),score=276.87 TRINITY_DN343_c0_g1_i1:65-2644(-)